MLKPAVKRSACDQCRAKRVQCIRAQDSTAHCARCSHMGVRCVTSAAGHPGRPPKQRDPLRTRRAAATPTDDTSSPPLASPESSVPTHSPGDADAHECPPDFWSAPGGVSAFFGPSSINYGKVNSQLQLPGFSRAEDDWNTMPHTGGISHHPIDPDIDPLFDFGEADLPLVPLPQPSSATSSLARFRDGIDQRIATTETYYADPAKVLQRCTDDRAGEDVENPAALLLMCTREFIDIIQSLTPAGHSHEQTEATLSTEVVLLALSSYLGFMRLFDSLFYRIYKHLYQVPPELYETLKVKSVLRIGGVSSLQDVSLRAYAMGILDTIHAEVQTLERHMGIPAEYCLSADAAITFTAAAPGIFSRADRAQLFRAVIAQDDVKSRRGGKSYAESARASIKDSMAFLSA